MDDMGDASHGALDAFAVRDIAFDNLDPVGFREQPIVTQGPYVGPFPTGLSENVGDQICADLAGRTCYQKQHGILPSPLVQARRARPSFVPPAGIPP